MTLAPRVSVIIPAFNLARYLPAAIDSALAQDSPGGPVEVIVVDDGSTDETAQVLAAYADRVKVVRQPNRGLVGAVDRGLEEVRGEFVALLDADDEWPRDRLRRHVAILDADPAVGLVHGDMEMIDAAGQVTHRSFFELQRLEPSDGRVLGRLLAGNFVSGGASTFRASVLPAIHPIPADAAYPDWWFAACVAAVAEIRTAGGVSNRYRYHGANMGLGSGPEAQPKIQRAELPWRRWMMRNLLDDDTVTVDHLRAAFQAWRFGLFAAASIEPEGARGLLEADHAGARAVLDRGARDGFARDARDTLSSRTLMRALAHDPFDGALAVDLEVALSRETGTPAADPAPPLITLQTRPHVTLTWLHELVCRGELLRSFARDAITQDDTTLLVLAPRGADLAGLVELVEAEPLLQDERCDITVVAEPLTTPAQAWLAARASSRLTTAASVPEPYGSLPMHGAAERPLPAAA